MKNSTLPEVLEQEKNVSIAFSKQSIVFDEADRKNDILRWMRSRVREHVLDLWKPGEQILELNAGTGLDAILFAEKGFHVHAIDNAKGMVDELNSKVQENKLSDKVTTQLCSFLELDKLKARSFNHIFSNFGGLNCTDKLYDVILSFSPLIKTGGTVTLVIMPPVCLWEMLAFFKGNFKLAFRRYRKGGALSNLEGVTFTTWYYSASRVKKMFSKDYTILSVIGLGVMVPPPYKEAFPIKYPKLFRNLIFIEKIIAKWRPFNSWGDHYIIIAKKLA